MRADAVFRTSSARAEEGATGDERKRKRETRGEWAKGTSGRKTERTRGRETRVRTSEVERREADERTRGRGTRGRGMGDERTRNRATREQGSERRERADDESDHRYIRQPANQVPNHSLPKSQKSTCLSRVMKILKQAFK